MKNIYILLFLLIQAFSPLVSQSVNVLSIYQADATVLNFVTDSIDYIEVYKQDNRLEFKLKDGSISNVNMGIVDSMMFENKEYRIPEIRLEECLYEPNYERIFCNVKIEMNDDAFLFDQGVCWAIDKAPTTLDNTDTYKYQSPQFFSTIDDLPDGVDVGVRAYAQTSIGTIYSDVQTVRTFSGNVTYTLAVDKYAKPEVYALLKEALDEACYFYNKYTTFEANIYVYQNDGIPTAQANYHGGVGFGANTRYMWVGTAMHEFAHFFGSGTTNAYKNLIVNGVWQGVSGQRVVKDVYGDEAVLKGDNVHFWPGGINQKEEVKSEADFIAHAKLVQAMLVDDCNVPTSF